MAINPQLFDGMAIFVEVVSSGTFTAAAANTGNSTSYISKEISKLEERLGVRLLHRTTRTLSLTPEGQVYFDQCQQLIDDAIEVENAVSGKQGKPKGVLKVSSPVAFGVTQLRPILVDYMRAYPDIRLELDLNDRKVDLIADGFDIVIRATGQLEDSSLVSRHLLSAQLLTLASPAYLKKHGTPHHPSELEKHRMIGYANAKSPNTLNYIDQDGSALKVYVDNHILTNNSEMMIEMAKSAQGVIRMPTFNLKDELERGELVTLFDNYPAERLGVYMVYPSRKHMSAKVRSFIDFVLGAAEG